MRILTLLLSGIGLLGLGVVGYGAIGSPEISGQAESPSTVTQAPPPPRLKVVVPFDSPAPPPPPGLLADGSLDVSKMPERIAVAAFDGQPLRDDEGRVVTVPMRARYEDPKSANYDAAMGEMAYIHELQVADAQRRGLRISDTASVTP